MPGATKNQDTQIGSPAFENPRILPVRGRNLSGRPFRNRRFAVEQSSANSQGRKLRILAGDPEQSIHDRTGSIHQQISPAAQWLRYVKDNSRRKSLVAMLPFVV